MNYPNNPSYRDEDYEGYVAAGLPAGIPVTPLSDEDVRMLEEAWNNPRAYELSKDEGFVSAGYVPPPVDPNRPLVPPEEEIAKLPRRARVAFAARCAHRVLPIASRFWVGGRKQHLEALRRAVHAIESASNDYPVHAVAGAARAAVAYATTVGSDTARAVARAVSVVSAASAAHATGSADTIAGAAVCAIESLLRVVTVRTISDLTTPARDFECLRWRAAVEKWTDDTPVPPAVFGPMWEGTPPAWWTDDILAGLPPEPSVEPSQSDEEHEPSPDGAPTSP